MISTFFHALDHCAVHMFSNDIGMEFGVEKCAVMVIRRGKLARSDDITLPDESVIKGSAEGDAYKYLGVLEAEEVKQEQLKNILKKEYKRRIRKVLQSKLNGGNMIKAINTWAVSLLRHSAQFVNWTKEEVREMDDKEENDYERSIASKRQRLSFISTKETGRQRTDWSRRLCGACHFGIEKLCQRKSR